MGSLTRILVGRINSAPHSGDFTTGMNAASRSLLAHEQQLVRLWNSNSHKEFSQSAPACSRLILEQGLAIVLGRLDPLRLITIIKGSNSTDFKLGQKNSSSFNWSKDVLPEAKPGPNGYWSQETISKLVHRSILDGHLADYLFSSCHSDLLDRLTDITASLTELPEWIIQVLKLEKGEHVLAAVRARAAEAYSVLSKGIHFEFFLGQNTMPSNKELREATSKSITALATTALYSHFSDISVQRISKNEALRCFLEITKKFQ